jgi:hypothetical protein
MIKDKLHTISDLDAINAAELLLKSSTSNMFNFTFDKIIRQEYVVQHGVDAEESVNLYFKAIVKDDIYRNHGWNDKKIWIQLIESDRYHDYPYFTAYHMEESDNVWKHHNLSNHVETIEFLKEKQLI